jgi:CubicO group peptidase (beta-lactamase class C family)
MSLKRRAPESCGFKAGGLAAADAVVAAAVADRVFPGAVAAVVKEDALVHLHPFGGLSDDGQAEPVVDDTIYDLASLTKVLATTAAAMRLVDVGRLDVSWPVARVLPEFHGDAKDRVTVAHLLSHASGLPRWAPLYRELAGSAAYVSCVAAMDLEYEPGSRSVYSDLGFILLGGVLERLAGEPLDVFVRREVFTPLAMTETLYLPPSSSWPRIAPTEHDPWRGRLLRGEVHDENAYAMGGVAPHAGLFGTAADVARFVAAVLAGGVGEGGRAFGEPTLERFVTPCGVPGSSYALGWDMPSGEASAAGRKMSRRAIGHLGFTGTSFWIDRERRLGVILLSNHVHPHRPAGPGPMRAVRAAFADAVVDALA